MSQPVAPIGKSLPRVDGVAKVTGGALYLDDLDAPGAWFGATVRSTVPHGVLEALDRDPAFDWSRVAFVTAADIPGKNAIALIEDDQPALVPVGGTVMHVDEPLALVAAPTRELARAAAAAVKPRIRALAAVFDVDAALAGAVKLHGDTNVFKQFLIRKGHASDAELDAAFANADVVIEGEYHTGAQEQMYIEPQAMMAEWKDGRCHIVGSMQCPYYVHKAMKPLLQLGADDVVITQSVTGGGFGGKEEYPSMLAAHVALLAKRAGHAVKIVYTRDEDIAATTKRHPARTRHRLAIDERGELAAIDIDVVMDGGAYLTLSPVVLSRGVLHAAGPYRCPVTRVRGRVVATNHPPHGAFRGFGAPQTTFAYERQLDKLARRRGEDPSALRGRLALRTGDTTATSQRLGASVGTDDVLGAVAAVAGEPPARAPAPHLRRGRGYAFYFHGAGFTGSGEQRLAGRASVAYVPGATAPYQVRASSTDIGQGVITMFTQIAASALGVDPALVHVIDPSTARVPDSGPTVASRTCMVVGQLVERAAARRKLRARRGARRHAARGARRDRAVRAAARHRVGRRDLHRRGIPGVRLGRVPGRRHRRSRQLRGAHPALRAGDRRGQGDQPGDRARPDRRRHAAGARLGAAREHRVPRRSGREREHDQLHRADVRRQPRARDHHRRGAVSVRAVGRQGRRRDPDGRPRGGGRERGRRRTRRRPRHHPDPAGDDRVRDLLRGKAATRLRPENHVVNVELDVNGTRRAVDCDPWRRLLDVLREDLRLTGTKEGCGEGECGACSVLLDGEVVNSCLVAVGQCHDRVVQTVEGLAKDGVLHPVQRALVEFGGAQCGICTPGIAVCGAAIVDQGLATSRDRIRELLAGNICRCTGYQLIVDAVERAAGER